MNPSETSATRSWRNRRQNSCSGERAATSPTTSCAGGGPSRNSRAPPPDGSSSAAPALISALPPARDVGAWGRSTPNLHLRQPSRQPPGAAKSDVPAHQRYSRAWIPCSTRIPTSRRTPREGGGAASRRRARGRQAAGQERPLAVRVRPRSLEEFVGQSHLLGAGSALRTAIEQGHPHSMVLYGPPGSGKTTLARIVAERSQAAFEELSAVAAGRAEVRAVIERAAHRRDRSGGARRRPNRCCSSTRSTASTRPSRTRCCRRSRRAW